MDRCFETVASKEGRKEDCFALLYLRNEFGKSVEELHPKVAWGGNDYGIDAFYIDKDRRNLYLYQFKWSKNHNLFRESLQRLISAGMERVFGNPLQDQNQNQMLLQLKSELIENQALVDRVLIHFVFNGDPEAAERSAVLDSLREDLENKKVYESIFRESYLHANASKILLAYKIQFRLGRILGEIYERGESKYGYITNARELIWALLVQGVLNDDELNVLCNQYGKTLTMEKDYTDYLKGLASKKVRLIVSDVIDDDEEYQKAMANGKYSFLGTKALYERCMNSAYKRERWTKRSL